MCMVLLKYPAHPARPSACRDRPSAPLGLSACRFGMPTVRPTASRPSATSSRSRSWAAIAMRVAAAEQFRQVDLQAADVADRRAGDGGRLVVGEHDRLLRTDPAARRTAASCSCPGSRPGCDPACPRRRRRTGKNRCTPCNSCNGCSRSPDTSAAPAACSSCSGANAGRGVGVRSFR